MAVVDRAAAAATPSSPTPADRRPVLMLGLALLGFGLNFWAWGLLSPLGPHYRETLGLSAFAQSFLVAVPVVVGALGRVPIGALTDRYGARVMFPAVTAATILPLLFLAQADSYLALVGGGFALGIAGTAFAVGVPFVNGWFPPHRRGFAIGVYGMGMGGTAIAGLTTVRLMQAYRLELPFYLVAAVLAGYAVAAAVLLRDPPGHRAAAGSWARRTVDTLRLRLTWEMSFLYAVGFGGIVAFGVYLPAYLRIDYGLTQADAALRAAGFILVAVLARPVGGWLSDRHGPVPVLVGAFGVVAIAAVAQAFQPPLLPVATLTLLTIAAMLGAAAGAVFALVALVAPARTVGTVTGIVGAAGGLGGFIPPLIMGAVFGSEGSYAIGLMLLSDMALAAAVYTAVRISPTRGRQPRTDRQARSGRGTRVKGA